MLFRSMYLFVAVVYFIISYFLSYLVQRLQARIAVPGLIAAGGAPQAGH